MSFETLEIAKNLIQKNSITPKDAGCQLYIADILNNLGFTVEHIQINDVANLWATYGNKKPDLCFVGHTDVVPAGENSLWKYNPFAAIEKNGRLYGRGAQDMKGAIAAWLNALTRFFKTNTNNGTTSIGVLLTSDEEGPSQDGIRKVAPLLQKRGVLPKYCIIGEPSSIKISGDTIKNGRRGSLSGKLSIKGKQGHIAYPENAINPIHNCLNVLHKLVKHNWDRAGIHTDFTATSLQISDIKSGLGVGNIIPEILHCDFNIRFNPNNNVNHIKKTVESILQQHNLNYEIIWIHNGDPFYTETGKFIENIQASINKVTGKVAKLSTSGGSSDGRFLAPLNTQVIELGLPNNSIHQINEHVKISDLNLLSDIYLACLKIL